MTALRIEVSEEALLQEVSTIHQHSRADGDAALRSSARAWLQSLLRCPLPDLPLEELLANCWLLGRVAEVVDAMRQGKSARLGAGQVLEQLEPRSNREQMNDFFSYQRLFDDLAIQKGNLFSLGDLAEGRSTTLVCRSFWDLAVALQELGVQDVPEFECRSLRVSMKRTTSLAKAAKFETSGSPIKVPSPKSFLPTLALSSSDDDSPDRAALTLKGWLPGAGKGSSKPRCASETSQGVAVGGEGRDTWSIAAALEGAAPELGDEVVAGGEGSAEVGEADEPLPLLDLLSPVPSPTALSPAAEIPMESPPSASPGRHRLSPGRIRSYGCENPVFSPACSPAHAVPAPAAADAAMATPVVTGACPVGAAQEGGEEDSPFQLRLSPPHDSTGSSPEGGAGFVAQLVAPEKPAHVQLLSALMNPMAKLTGSGRRAAEQQLTPTEACLQLAPQAHAGPEESAAGKEDPQQAPAAVQWGGLGGQPALGRHGGRAGQVQEVSAGSVVSGRSCARGARTGGELRRLALLVGAAAVLTLAGAASVGRRGNGGRGKTRHHAQPVPKPFPMPGGARPTWDSPRAFGNL